MAGASFQNVASIVTELCQHYSPEDFTTHHPQSEIEYLVAKKTFDYLLEVLDDYVEVEDYELGEETGRLEA